MADPGSLYRDSRPKGAREKSVCNEWARQGEKVAVGLLSFLLVLRPPFWILLTIAAFATGVAAFGHVIWKSTLRGSEREAGYPVGKLYWAGAVLVLLVLFRNKVFVAATAWFVFAVGDAAATLLGTKIGRVRLPWNASKTMEGTFGFVVFGILAGTAILRWTGLPLDEFTWRFVLVAAGGSALIGAAVESLPLPVDDNITVPIAIAIFLALFSHPILMQYKALA